MYRVHNILNAVRTREEYLAFRQALEFCEQGDVVERFLPEPMETDEQGICINKAILVPSFRQYSLFHNSLAAVKS